MAEDDVDVVVIGAGLAGLRCATVIAAAGRDVRVLEQDDDVGGRVRTDAVDGFLCDRGFQVLNPAYPELPHAVDVDALDLQPFGAGVAVRRQSKSAVLAHPLREPKLVPKMLLSGAIRPADVAAVARWALPALRPSALKSHVGADITLKAALDKTGLGGELRRVIDRFLAGVLLEDTGNSSNAFALLLARVFLLGVPALPAAGMQALPRQMAKPLVGRISLNHKVSRIDRDGGRWLVSGPDTAVRASDVVVAADPTTSAALTGSAASSTHGVVTDWWSAEIAPTSRPMLWVDGRRHAQGPVLNTAVISAAAPSYAPRGQHLISASALLEPDGSAPAETATRRHAADIMGGDGRPWKLLTRNVIRHALPAQSAPLRVRRPVAVGDGLWWCGDHRDTASIQGALVSGRRTAKQILRSRP
ncbi:FAD-dependent oxidoreductase [Candidatus Mycobacterium wuenschmannii]|uniref:FAD-dependent oxidoreductase n=1 Tax=Candidatus Mycobacterium wuenschmannii TaxID=3027808 RepID=A0ABY8W1A2_9MYCO|nr:FAD-dependent oxidoreductase [Candidatus Mycobacterium wuenschmannii]WIM88896.1 FAD-dependent oxidoreductase [Candidatus Mycobacterium wuenschmannii]